MQDFLDIRDGRYLALSRRCQELGTPSGILGRRKERNSNLRAGMSDQITPSGRGKDRLGALYSQPVKILFIVTAIVDPLIGWLISISPRDVGDRQLGIQESVGMKYTVPLFDVRQGMVTLADPGRIFRSAGHVGFFVRSWKLAMHVLRSFCRGAPIVGN